MNTNNLNDFFRQRFGQQFEHWAETEGINIVMHNGRYVSTITQAFWECWIAARDTATIDTPPIHLDGAGEAMYRCVDVHSALDGACITYGPADVD